MRPDAAAALPALAARDAELLAKILGRLGSDHDGERAAAGLLASQFIKARGLSWYDVIQPHAPQPRRSWHDDDTEEPTVAGRPWRAVARELAADPDGLSAWEASFAQSLARWPGRPSPKQLAVLRGLAEKVGL